jgi:hypothetical protein
LEQRCVRQIGVMAAAIVLMSSCRLGPALPTATLPETPVTRRRKRPTAYQHTNHYADKYGGHLRHQRRRPDRVSENTNTDPDPVLNIHFRC